MLFLPPSSSSCLPPLPLDSFILVFISLRNLERANNAEDKPFTLVASWPHYLHTAVALGEQGRVWC